MTDPGTALRDALPELAVVVIALGAPATLEGAVSSLLEQDAPLEIVVVNSGGGNARAKLLARGLDVTVIERDEPLSPGAARNTGIEATRAPFVAFLASDCRAGPGWATKRLARHRDGDAAVGSALLPLPADSVIAWASHLALFVRRLPQNSRLTALPYGASFRRSLFERHGLFAEETRIGEDTAFAASLPAEMRPVWAPDVVTLHETPSRLASMLGDQVRRGRLAASHEPDAYRPGSLLEQFWRRATDPIKLSRRFGLGDDKIVRRAWLLLPLCAGAYCLGLASGPKR
jgi:glycosyltransferase involved in cell wall biosynthesis